jgi:FAD/FMN-containing dehydrogenase
VRPGDAAWPAAPEWEQLRRAVDGRLLALESPFSACNAESSKACTELLHHLDNQFFIGDQPALTQVSGWANAWLSQPSVYAVAAASTADVVAAVNFARTHRLRLVIKGGGHSYQGTSCSADSLLIWTRAMNSVVLQDAFVPAGAPAAATQPAVSVAAGAMWIDAYDAVTTRGGRYVQGGGCTTVGVAGLVQGGGFGSFSKNYGTGAANLLEAEVVTADGAVRVANRFQHSELFWALQGGGGSSFGVVTRLTLRTHPLPEFFGGVIASVSAKSDAAFRTLIAKVMEFYARELCNPTWGEQISIGPDNRLKIDMVFQGIDRAKAQATWQPLFDWIRDHGEYAFVEPAVVLAVPAQHFWDVDWFREHVPGVMVADDRPQAPRHHAAWKGDQDQAGWFIHRYSSRWLPVTLLSDDRRSRLVDAFFAASRHWRLGLHFNKGLAGGSAGAIAATRDTATNPRVLDAFALAIIAGGGDAAYPGMPGATMDLANARDRSDRIGLAFAELVKVAPDGGAYVAESDYFEPEWQRSFWGGNYARLAAAKNEYDPDGLFFVHHGVGSEGWSDDGFSRRRA